MRDLNFFEPYIEKRSFKISLPVILFALIILYALYTFVFGIFNYSQIKSLENNVADLKSVAENPTTLAKVAEIKALEEEMNTFRDEVEKIKEMDKVVEASDIINEEYLALISSKMPEDLFFTTFSVNNREIQVSGISKDEWTVAEFGNALRDIDNVDEIYISNITGEEDYYTFSMMITLKEVGIYDEIIAEEEA